MKAIYGTVIALAAPLLFAQQSENIPNFNGIWLAGGGGAPQGGMGALGAMGAQGGMAAPGGGRGRPRPTASAQRAMDAYDLLVDDPAYGCSPASLSRAWRNPTPTEIEQREKRMILRHEYMDVGRIIYVDGRDHSANANPNVVGNSIG